MAALRFEATADRKPEVHRLGSHRLEPTAHTWRTFVTVEMQRNGTFIVTMTRDGATLCPSIVMSVAEEPL